MELATATNSLLPATGSGGTPRFRSTIVLHDRSVLTAYIKVPDLRKVLVELLCAELAVAVGIPVPRFFAVLVPLHDGSGFVYGFGSEDEGYTDLSQIGSGYGNFASEALTWVLNHDSPPLVGAFDEWIGNNDRHIGNVVYFAKRDSLKFIDHAAALKETSWTTGPLANNRFLHDYRSVLSDKPIEREMLARRLARDFVAAAHSIDVDLMSKSLGIEWFPEPRFMGAMTVMLSERQPVLAAYIREQLAAPQMEFRYGE